MPVTFHPDPGTVVICDFAGYRAPEMLKRRPVVVVSPRLRHRDNLCTVVPLSTTAPRTVCAHHCQIPFEPPLPPPYSAPLMWAKADMLCAVSFDRLSLPFIGKAADGKREYDVRHVSEEDLRKIRSCFLSGLGLDGLTAHL